VEHKVDFGPHGPRRVVVEDAEFPALDGRVIRRIGQVELDARCRLRDELHVLPVLDDDDAAGHQLVGLVVGSRR
jgi:hypothetical protein